MGYESKLYIVRKSNSTVDPYTGLKWGEVIASYDLCLASHLGFADYPETDCFIYPDVGDFPIIKDAYNKPLKEIPIEDAIKILKDAAEKEPLYRRWAPIIGLLEGFNLDQWENLVVLHYGY